MGRHHALHARDIKLAPCSADVLGTAMTEPRGHPASPGIKWLLVAREVSSLLPSNLVGFAATLFKHCGGRSRRRVRDEKV